MRRLYWYMATFSMALAGAEATGAEITCSSCHAKQTARYSEAAMTRALLRPVSNADLLAENMTFRDGAWSYRIVRENGKPTYRVSDGQTTLDAPILWSFGSGKAGQTYVFEHDGGLYESRVSYYTRVKGLDLTLGAVGSKPDSLLLAAGRKMTTQDVSECFGCHSSGASPSSKFAMDTMHPGVQCTACHDNVEKHQAALSAKSTAVVPKRLGKLTAEETNELCGRCHRTWEQIAINGPRGVANVRFQPYRLTLSKCYDADDRRIGCSSCHDPHSPLEVRAEAYDARCRSCHSPDSKSLAATRICKVSTQKCSDCHMPKYEIPGSHMIFSDHRIRIVRDKEKYPD
jgi:hypothetical protein